MELKTKETESSLLSREERKKKILEKIKRANDEEWETSWSDRGIPNSKRKSKIESGRVSRAKGGNFESRVRKDLESRGWVVDKWSNNIDLDTGRVVPAKRKFNPFSKVMTIGTGFPDFIAFQMVDPENGKFNVVGVEVKTNGTLSREEKEKCQLLVDRDIFSEIWVAKKTKIKNRIHIEYENALSILKRMRK